MNLANLSDLTNRFAFYTKYLNLRSKYSLFTFKTFQNETKFKNLNSNVFKGLLILTEFRKFGKFARKFRQICQLSLSFKKTHLVGLRKFTADMQLSSGFHVIC